MVDVAPPRHPPHARSKPTTLHRRRLNAPLMRWTGCATPSVRNGWTRVPMGGGPARESGAHGPRTRGQGIQDRRRADSSGPSHDVGVARLDPPHDEGAWPRRRGLRSQARERSGSRWAPFDVASHTGPPVQSVDRTRVPAPSPPPAGRFRWGPRHPLESLARRVGRAPRIDRDHLDWRNRIGPFAWSGSIRRPCCVISIVPSAARRRAAQRTASIQSRHSPGA